MSVQALVAAILLLAVLLAAWRQRRQGRLRWRSALLLQALAALALYCGLYPPRTPRADTTLWVLAAGADPAVTERAATAGARLVALPEAPPGSGAEAVPDLATALRRHPGVAGVRVHGLGLPWRDHDALRGRAFAFEAAALPAGLVELQRPDAPVAGQQWRLSGRVAGLGAARVELRDPGERLLAQATVAADGRFVLDGLAGTAGRSDYELRLFDDPAAAPVERLALPLAIAPGRPLQLLVLGGGPNPELRQLRRHAVDAGLELSSRLLPGPDLGIVEGALGASLPDAATLARLDLLLLDERGWEALGADGRERVAQAVDEGLGLLLRLTGPLTEAGQADLQRLGFSVRPADLERGVRLVPPAGVAAAAEAPLLARRPLAVEAVGAVPLLRAADGTPLALWRAAGRGRVGLWWLLDSWKLALHGDRGAHGRLWSMAYATLARARQPAGPRRLGSDLARPHTRQVLCGIGAGAWIEAADGSRQALLPDPAAAGCAAWWPRQPGWHRLEDPAGGDAGATWLHVAAPASAPALAAHALQQATLQLAAASPGPSAGPATTDSLPGPRWPWLLAWLLAAALAWWLEKQLPGSREQLPGSSCQ